MLGSDLLANVRLELGNFNDVVAFPDARVYAYLNEAQDLLEPEVLLPSRSTFTISTPSSSNALPTDFKRLIKIIVDPDTSGTHILPPYMIIGKTIYWTDAGDNRQTVQCWLFYEASWPDFVAGTVLTLPDPGPEALVAFACHRCFEKLAADRDAYKRYATQTGSNAVGPEDLERLAEMYRQRYLQTREVMAQRVLAAPAQAIARFR